MYSGDTKIRYLPIRYPRMMQPISTPRQEGRDPPSTTYQEIPPYVIT